MGVVHQDGIAVTETASAVLLVPHFIAGILINATQM